MSAKLDAALPDVFQLTTVMPPRMETRPDGARVYAPVFDASLQEDGAVRLTGPVQDMASRAAIGSFASALFGHDRVTNLTVIDPALPEGWPGRVLAGVEALAALKEGKLKVTPEAVAVEGWGIDEHVEDKVAALLAAKIGQQGAVVDVAFNAEAAAAAEMAARPRPEICVDQISAILEAGSIQFAAGSATIVPESRGVIAAIADVLRGCPGADFEIAGHTDSQGSAEVEQAAERRSGAGGPGGAARRGPAAGAADRPRLRRRPAGRRQRLRHGPRQQPAHRVHAGAAARRRRRGGGNRAR